MIVLLMGTGLVLTILTGFGQFRHLHTALREVLGKVFSHGQGRGSVTPFQAVATALASTVGVGNIAGVATAIVLGGPGVLQRESRGATRRSSRVRTWLKAPTGPRRAAVLVYRSVVSEIDNMTQSGSCRVPSA